MKNFYMLIKLKIKQKLKIIPQLILIALALSVLVSGIIFCSYKFLYSDKKASEQNLLLVSEDDNEMTSLIVSAIKNSKSLESLCSVKTTDLSSAKKELKNNNSFAAIVIPDGFLSSLDDGENYPIYIYYSPKITTYSLILTELSSAGTRTLRAAQAGVYALYDFYNEHNKLDYESDANSELNMTYLKNAFTRAHTFKTETVTSTGNLSILNYYIAAGIIILLLLTGIVFINYFSFDATFSRLLSVRGINVFYQITAEIISIFFMLFIIIFIPSLLLVALNTSEIITLSASINIPSLSINAFIVSFAMSCVITLICKLSSNKSIAYILLILITVISSFISGFFIPASMLPAAFGNIGRLLPFVYMHKCIGNIIMGEIQLYSVLILLAYSMILILLAMICEIISDIFPNKLSGGSCYE